MELALLVYLVNILPDGFEGYWFALTIGLIGLFAAVGADYNGHGSFEDSFKKVFSRKLQIILIVSTLGVILLLTRQTAIYMAGAYLVQEVTTSGVAAGVGNKTKRVILNQLDKWAEEVPELKDILQEEITGKGVTKMEEVVK